MKAHSFEYVRAKTLREAFDAYAQASGDCRYLAGGQSLIPSLSLRQQSPSVLIDISRIGELHGIALSVGRVRIGALTTHGEMLTSPDIARYAPLFRLAAPHVAHPAIRNKGTIGGSIALANPAAEFPAVVLAVDAEFEIAGPEGVRCVKADGFFKGPYESGLEPQEIITAIFVPTFGTGDQAVFDELARRRGDSAIVGAAIQGRFAEKQLEAIRIAFFSVGPVPVRARQAEDALVGRALSPEIIAMAQTALEKDLDPAEDAQTTPAMRLHLARVLLERLLGQFGERLACDGVRA